MTNEELNTALYEKMFAEQETYRAWLLSQTPCRCICGLGEQRNRPHGRHLADRGGSGQSRSAET